MKTKALYKWEYREIIKFLNTKNYKSSGEFKEKSLSLYQVASRKKLIDRIRNYYGWHKRVEYYTNDKALKIAKKFDSFKAWKASEHYLKTTNKKMIMDTLLWSEKYSFEKCMKSTKGCKSLGHWRLKKRIFHDASIRYEFFDKICELNNWKIKRRQTIQKLIIEAFNSSSINSLRIKNKYAYRRIKECGWEKNLFETTNKLKQDFLKLGRNESKQMKDNLFPISPRLKTKLINDFWREAA